MVVRSVGLPTVAVLYPKRKGWPRHVIEFCSQNPNIRGGPTGIRRRKRRLYHILIIQLFDISFYQRVSLFLHPYHHVGSSSTRNRMVSLVGFEPTTYSLEGSRSIQLSYRDILILRWFDFCYL